MKEIPPHIKEKIDKLTDELKKIYKLAEESWEGCDGCDENDKRLWINGFQKGYYTAKPDHLSDEEIEEQSWLYEPRNKFDAAFLREAFMKGAEWYREQLKQKQ